MESFTEKLKAISHNKLVYLFEWTVTSVFCTGALGRRQNAALSCDN